MTFGKVVLGFFVAFLLISLIKNIFGFRKTLEFYQSFKNEYEKEKKNNIVLKTQALKDSDPYEVEKIIRNKLNLARPDEISVLIASPTPTPTVLIPAPQSIPHQWWSIFFGN